MIVSLITTILNKPFYLRHRHFILYLTIALSGLVLDVVSFNICYLFFSLDERLAQLIGGHVGFVNNFLLNAFLNFKKTDKIMMRFASYYFITLVGMLVRDQLMILFAVKMEFNPSIVHFCALGFVSVAQFLVNKFITFRPSKRSI